MIIYLLKYTILIFIYILIFKQNILIAEVNENFHTNLIILKNNYLNTFFESDNPSDYERNKKRKLEPPGYNDYDASSYNLLNKLKMFYSVNEKNNTNSSNCNHEYVKFQNNSFHKNRNLIQQFFCINKSPEDIRELQSKIMRMYIDFNVDPCQNFYKFACGNWKKYYTIPPDRSSYDTFEMVRENLDFLLKDILVSNNSKLESNFFDNSSNLKNGLLDILFNNSIINDTSNATNKAKTLYKSCMQEDVIAARGDKPLKDVLNYLGGWPIISTNWNDSNFNFIWLLAHLRLFNNDVLISQWVGPDMKNSNEHIVHIDQSNLGLPSREYYLENTNIKYLKAYKVYMLSIVNLMGSSGEQVIKDIEEMINFETDIASIMASSEERRNISDIYLRTDLATLSLYFPQIDWNQYFNLVFGRNIDLKCPVALYCMKYLHSLIYKISITPFRTLQNYLLWKFIRHRTSTMDRRFLEVKQRFYFILFGREQQPPRWQFCVNQVNNNMGMAVGSLFVQRYFSKTSRSDTIEMTELLQEAFRNTLLENNWLDNHTKEYASMKINQIDLKIGYPDFILNNTELNKRYYDVTINTNFFFENIIIILKHLTRVEQTRLGTSVNRTLWSTPPAVVNAYYSRNKNQIMFPAGMLQPPFYHPYFPKALNFGGIGVVIGHEITHGFDDKGRLFDHFGNLHLWWRESSIEKFYEKSQCLIDQYSQYYLPELRTSLDGFLTQGENIADNGGLKQSFRAYKKWLLDHPNVNESLPGMNFTGEQLFFLNFAQVWCGQQRLETAKNRMKTSVHSPGIFRVIGVLSNSDEFAEVFRCPKNSPMNPEHKCIIW